MKSSLERLAQVGAVDGVLIGGRRGKVFDRHFRFIAQWRPEVALQLLVEPLGAADYITRYGEVTRSHAVGTVGQDGNFGRGRPLNALDVLRAQQRKNQQSHQEKSQGLQAASRPPAATAPPIRHAQPARSHPGSQGKKNHRERSGQGKMAHAGFSLRGAGKIKMPSTIKKISMAKTKIRQISPCRCPISKWRSCSDCTGKLPKSFFASSMSNLSGSSSALGRLTATNRSPARYTPACVRMSLDRAASTATHGKV